MSNPFKRGQRIEDDKGRTGYVLKVLGLYPGAKTKEKVLMLIDGAEKTCAGPYVNFKPSKAKEETKAHWYTNAKHKKGDRVKTKEGDGYIHGTISKGGSNKVTMVVDGGKEQTSGDAYWFFPSDKALPTEPESPMDKYKVYQYKEAEHLSQETTAFTAKISCENKLFLNARNQGCGGCNIYESAFKNGIHRQDAVKQIEADVEVWARQSGMKGDSVELLDCWISWYTSERPLGITAKEYWGGWNDILAKDS